MSAQAARYRSYGNPVQVRKAAGRLCPSLKDRGRKHTLACRQVAMALATLKQGN